MNELGININGSEGNNIMGEFAEDEFEAFFSNFAGWKLLYRNVDLKDLKYPDENKTENKGYDFIYELFEPFEKIKQGAIIESKKIEDISDFVPSRLSDDIEIFKYKIKKAINSQELHDDQKIRSYDLKSFRYGILCYRFIKFDFDRYYKTLEKYKPSERTRDLNFPVIFILSNDKLHAFSELKKCTKQLTFYNRDPFSNNQLVESEKLSLFHMFSDIIPFRESGADNNNNSCGILSFDKPSVESFLFIEHFCMNFNFEISKIIFVNCDFTKESLYNQYKSEIQSLNDIEALYFGSGGMDCSQKLNKVFK
ncbi:hypothetical protein RSJ42_08605 [Methanosarcina hadiensis]|uniref:hypothetical protein n=1 Tax=Methanosarcina hadiensis TaxID=3078083 RepID=UPI003977D476